MQTKNEIILASKSKVRKEILEKNNIKCKVVASNLDEEPIKETLIKEGASPELISKNLAEIKAIKVSSLNNNHIVLGADSVIDLENSIISKPKNRDQALDILKRLNGKEHYLISSVTHIVKSFRYACLLGCNKESARANVIEPENYIIGDR